MQETLYKKIYNVSKSYQNSWANLKTANNILSEICRSQSLPNIFVTLSSSEHKLPDLEKLLCPNNYQWDGFYKNRIDLVKKAGFISVSLLNERFEKIIKFIKREFDVDWHFKRIEIQNRGSLHLHALFKFKDAPDSEFLIQ